MTVGELIEELSAEDPERIVVLQKDAEGNGYSPLYSLRTGTYLGDTLGRGEVGLEFLSTKDRMAGYTEADVITGGVPAVILAPMN